MVKELRGEGISKAQQKVTKNQKLFLSATSHQ